MRVVEESMRIKEAMELPRLLLHRQEAIAGSFTHCDIMSVRPVWQRLVALCGS